MLNVYRASSRRFRARLALVISGVTGLPGCATTMAGAAPRFDAVSALPRNAEGSRAPSSRGGAPTESISAGDIATLERSLAEEAKLPAIVRIALARNPDLVAARERARAASEVAPAAAHLPDPELEYQLWAAPLTRPYALDEAQMHMVGVRQTFPAPGTLQAEGKVAAAEADMARQAQLAKESELLAEIRRTYVEYHLAEREYRVHLEHVRLAQQVLDLARGAYQSGRGTQQDVLRAAVEMSRLHNDVATIDGNRRTTRALLNLWMARDADAPLGPPAAIELAETQLRVEELERIAASRPDVAAAESAVRARQSELEAVRSNGRWPSFMLGAQYMYMPPMAEPHNYGVTVSMSLPWFNPRYDEEARATEAEVAAERADLSSSRNVARYELHAAAERLSAARESLVIIDRELLPQVTQSYESAQAAYRGGSDSLALFDALRALLDVRIERERAVVRVEDALIDVERAIGRSIPGSTEGDLP